MRLITVAAIAAVLGLPGCATPYSDAGLTGGHRSQRISAQLQKVDFYGNGYITSDQVQAYAMYRCAEIARDQKKAHFIIYDSLLAAANQRPSSQPRVGTLGNKPTASAFLALLDAPARGSHDTQAVLRDLGPTVKAAGGKQ